MPRSLEGFLIFRPDQSALPGEANAIGLAAALPRGPQYQALPDGHFIFADVGEPFLLSLAPEACKDPPSVRRAAIHVDIETRIAASKAHHMGSEWKLRISLQCAKSPLLGGQP
jgi:hypothetical protein